MPKVRKNLFRPAKKDVFSLNSSSIKILTNEDFQTNKILSPQSTINNQGEFTHHDTNSAQMNNNASLQNYATANQDS
jgi:hypothetical protein